MPAFEDMDSTLNSTCELNNVDDEDTDNDCDSSCLMVIHIFM